jgi:lipid-binding SYLF domain-containing protein
MTQEWDMHKIKSLFAIAGLGLSLGLMNLPAIAEKTPAEKAENVKETLENFRNAEVSRPYFESAYGYAVFPTIGKGAIGVGGGGGNGQVFEKGVLVGESKMVQLSVGLQMGGQAYSQIVFFENKAAFDEFTRDSFEFSADASAVAITAGANAEVGTKGLSAGASTSKDNAKTMAQYNKGMAVLTLAKGGLMYQAALAGQKYKFTPSRERSARN